MCANTTGGRRVSSLVPLYKSSGNFKVSKKTHFHPTFCFCKASSNLLLSSFCSSSRCLRNSWDYKPTISASISASTCISTFVSISIPIVTTLTCFSTSSYLKKCLPGSLQTQPRLLLLLSPSLPHQGDHLQMKRGAKSHLNQQEQEVALE